MYGQKHDTNIHDDDARVAKLARAIQKRGFSITAYSDGLVLKDDFLCPCVVMAPGKQPKIRYKNEPKIFKNFIKGTKLKWLDDFNRKEVNAYFKLLDQEKETAQFKSWRVKAKGLVSSLKGEIRKFNFQTKEKDRNLRLSLMSFDDGSVRLDFGEQNTDKPRKKFKKLTERDKEKIREKMLNYFVEFTVFLGSKTKSARK